jgi:exopolysaccharide biosynthesis polyprenyl glycosylphosphotransferase
MTASLVSVSTRTQTRLTGGLRYISSVALGLDLLVITISITTAVLGRSSFAFSSAVRAGAPVDSELGAAGPLIILGWVVAIALAGGYRGQVFGAGTDEYKRVVNASLATAALAGIACYLLRYPLARGFFILAFLVGIPLLVLGRFVLRRSLQQARRRGALLHRVVIAGSEAHVDEIASVLRRETWLGYNVIGALAPELGERTMTHSGIPLLGTSSSIAQVALDAEADVVFLAGGAFSSAAEMRRLAWELEHEDVQVVIAPSVTDVSSERVSVRPVGGLPLIHLEKPRSDAAVRRAKRMFDIVGSLGLILLFSPVLAVAALQVYYHDRGPMLFRQTRVGRDGKAFGVWKFRTMVTNAEQMLTQLHQAQGYESGLFKMENDPRVTRPGRWLRRFSVDELPQLWNVLKGDMSLVGPRPPLAHEVAQYDDDMTRRLRVRPGMTGLWQVSGRSELAWTEAIRLDLYYVDNWSMLQDLTILAKTFGAVFGSRGAY